jgi:hypothetical protein
VTERRKALIVCPGRGTYGKSELGYLKRFHGDKGELIGAFDRLRSERGQPTLSELDGADRFSPALHTRGDIASPLIFAASYADFLALDRSRFDVAAVTGNSMGWYTALAVGGAVDAEHGFRIIDAMGENSQAGQAGGQVLFTLVDAEWSLLLRGPVYVVLSDARFVPILRDYFATVPGAEHVHPVVLGRDDLADIPDDAPVYVTRSARARLGNAAVPGRLVPPARIFSPDSARELLRIVVRGNLEVMERERTRRG